MQFNINGKYAFGYIGKLFRIQFLMTMVDYLRSKKAIKRGTKKKKRRKRK